MGASHKVNVRSSEPNDDGLVDIVVSRAQARRQQQNDIETARKDIENDQAASATSLDSRKKRRVTDTKEYEWVPGGIFEPKRQFIGIYNYSDWRTENISENLMTQTNDIFDLSHYPEFPDMRIVPEFGFAYTIVPDTGPCSPCNPDPLPKDSSLDPAQFGVSCVYDYMLWGVYNAGRSRVKVGSLGQPSWKLAIWDLAEVKDLEDSDNGWIDKSTEDDYWNLDYTDPNYMGLAWAKDFMERLELYTDASVYTIEVPDQPEYKTWDPSLDDRFPGFASSADREYLQKEKAPFELGESLVMGMMCSGTERNQYDYPEWVVSHSPDGRYTWAYELRIVDILKCNNGYPAWVFHSNGYDIYKASRFNFYYSPPQSYNYSYIKQIRKYQQQLWYTRIKIDHATGTKVVNNGVLPPWDLEDPDTGNLMIDENYFYLATEGGSQSPDEPAAPSLHRGKYNIFFDPYMDHLKSSFSVTTGFHSYTKTLEIWGKICDDVLFDDDPSTEWRRLGYAEEWVFDLENDTIMRTGIVNRSRLLATQGQLTNRDFFIGQEGTNWTVDGRKSFMKVQTTGVFTYCPPVPNCSFSPAQSYDNKWVQYDLVSDVNYLDTQADISTGTFNGQTATFGVTDQPYGYKLDPNYDADAQQHFTIRVKVPGLKDMDPTEAGKYRFGVSGDVNSAKKEFVASTWTYNLPAFPAGTVFEIQFTPQDLQWQQSVRRLMMSSYTQTNRYPNVGVRFPRKHLGVVKSFDGSWCLGENYDADAPDEVHYVQCDGTPVETQLSKEFPFGKHHEHNPSAGTWQFISNPIIAPGSGDASLPFSEVTLNGNIYKVIV
jgi:hypothetical protein